MVKFKFLTGDVDCAATYGGKWMSNPQSNGEFTYYFVVELINWVESVGERDAPKEKYNLSLSVVSPEQAGEENMRKAYNDCDMLIDTPEMQVEALHAYAGGVPIWNSNGNNWQKLMKQARKEALVASMLIGFYLDRPVNRMGETGWEALKLTDPRKVLERVLAN